MNSIDPCNWQHHGTKGTIEIISHTCKNGSFSAIYRKVLLEINFIIHCILFRFVVAVLHIQSSGGIR
jgi:hypothetical protein